MISVQDELVGTNADLKPVPHENLHFTVKFLGEISEADIAEVKRRLSTLDLSAEEVSLRGVGAFPNPRRPSVIWIGVAREDVQKITPLAERVIAVLDGLGEREERGFHAHITIARVRSGRSKEALFAFLEKHADHDFGHVKFETLKLKSSELTPRGPIYTDVGVFGLK